MPAYTFGDESVGNQSVKRTPHRNVFVTQIPTTRAGEQSAADVLHAHTFPVPRHHEENVAVKVVCHFTPAFRFANRASPSVKNRRASSAVGMPSLNAVFFMSRSCCTSNHNSIRVFSGLVCLMVLPPSSTIP